MNFEKQLLIAGISSATALFLAIGCWMASSIDNLDEKSDQIYTDLEVVKIQVLNLNEKFDKYIDRHAVIPLTRDSYDNYAVLKKLTEIPQEPYEKN